MKLPTWLKTVIVGAGISISGWAVVDRLHLGERLTRIETFVEDVRDQLKTINQKLDRILENR